MAAVRRNLSSDRTAAAAAPPAWRITWSRRVKVTGFSSAHHEEVRGLRVVSPDVASSSDSRSEAATREPLKPNYVHILIRL